MALTVVFVSGPRRSGKSTVIQQIISDCSVQTPHYLRIALKTGDKRQPVAMKPPEKDCGVASAQWIGYDEDRAYEFLPTVLDGIHRRDRHAMVILEADADPILRHAFPYDTRIFVMPAPQRSTEVFRTKAQATEAFQDVLDDTAVFAKQIYGMVDNGDDSDSDGEVKLRRPPLTSAQVRGLMNSPLGDELATRILLQPSHHGLLECDVLIVNSAIGGNSSVADSCVQRLERVLSHLRGPEGRHHVMFSCDIMDRENPRRRELFERLGEMLGCHSESESVIG